MDIEQFKLLAEEAEKVDANMGLVKWIVKQWNPSQDDFEDMVQRGAIGLIKAVRTFDEKESKFATYASHCINNELGMWHKENKKLRRIVSLEEPTNKNKNDRKDELTLGSMIEDKQSSSSFRRLETIEILEKALEIILNCFPTKQKAVMLLYAADILQDEIANFFEMTQSGVSRSVKTNINKLRRDFARYYKRSYRKVYQVKMEDAMMKITFATTDVANFKNAFANFILRINGPIQITDFEMNVSKGRATIYLPAEKESLAFLGLLVKEIEDFQLRYELGEIPKESSDSNQKQGTQESGDELQESEEDLQIEE